MSYGHPTRAQWGTLVWGDVAPGRQQGVMLDAAVSKPGASAQVQLDAAVLAAREARLLLDAVALKEQEASVSLDAYTYRLPTEAFRAPYTEPMLLVELRLGTGTLHLSSGAYQHAGLAWEGRLVAASQVMRTLTRGSDQVSLVLEDTDAGGSGQRFRDLFRQQPPEGRGVSIFLALQGQPPAARLHIFEGYVERVPGGDSATIRLDCVRAEVVEDRLLGQLVTREVYPGAPAESVGRMLPIVFGEVSTLEGVVVDTTAVSRLAQGLLADDTALRLRDASEFPAFPPTVVQVGEERVRYVQKQGNVLAEVTRGWAGTAAADHPANAEVVEVSTFRVKFASHPLHAIEAIRFLDQQGNLAEPVPGPDTLDHVAAQATWSALPRLRAPETEPVYLRVHFHEAAASNLAPSPEKAAREAVGYETFGFSPVEPVAALALATSVEGLGVPGDVQRVWLAVVFDPGDQAQLELPRRGEPRASFPGLRGGSFLLSPEDQTPREVARHDDRTNDRFYDATLESEEPVPQEEVRFLSPTEVVDGGVWTNASPGRIVDGDEETYSASILMSAVEGAIVSAREFRARVSGDQNLEGFSVTAARLVLVSGWELSPFTTPLRCYLEGSRGKLVATEFEANTRGPAGTKLGFVRGVETFSREFDPALLGANLQAEDLADLTFVIEPGVGGVNVAGLWVARELRLELTLQRQPEAQPELDARRAVSNYFEVTSYVGGDWAFFSDPLRGGEASVSVQAGLVRVLEVFWVVEHRPLQLLTSRVPRVFARVRSYPADGDPTRAAEEIITRLPPNGMGLGADRIAREDYNPVRASLRADGIRVDFAVRQQVSARALLAELADQADMRETWERGRHRLVRKPSPASALDVFRTLTSEDVLEDALAFSRTALDDVRTRLSGRFRVYGPTGRTSEAVELVDAAAEATFGRREEVRDLALLESEAAARKVLALDLARRREPRWLLDLQVPLLGLELQLGDVVRVEHLEGTWAACEVLDLSLETEGLLRVKIRAVCWQP